MITVGALKEMLEIERRGVVVDPRRSASLRINEKKTKRVLERVYRDTMFGLGDPDVLREQARELTLEQLFSQLPEKTEIFMSPPPMSDVEEVALDKAWEFAHDNDKRHERSLKIRRNERKKEKAAE